MNINIKKIVLTFINNMKSSWSNGDYVKFAIMMALAIIIVWFVSPIVKIVGWIFSIIITICILYFIDSKYGDKMKFWKKK